MPKSPLETLKQLFEAINRHDIEAAIALYEPDAIMIAEPGKPVRGKAAVKAALAGFIALKPVLAEQGHELIECGDAAMYYSKWSLTGTGPDGKPVQMGATSSDLLRRQADGAWLIAIDNPWGAAILG